MFGSLKEDFLRFNTLYLIFTTYPYLPTLGSETQGLGISQFRKRAYWISDHNYAFSFSRICKRFSKV